MRTRQGSRISQIAVAKGSALFAVIDQTSYICSLTMLLSSAARSTLRRSSAALLRRATATHLPALGMTAQTLWQNTSHSFSTQTVDTYIPDMMCRQCEQTDQHKACVTQGICGKTSETSALQDCLTEALKSLSLWCVAARQVGGVDLEAANVLTLRATFSCLTNVNFSSDRIEEFIQQVQAMKNDIQQQVLDKGGEAPSVELANMDVSDLDHAALEQYGHDFCGLASRSAKMNHEDAFSLNEIGTYGLRGTCACKLLEEGRRGLSI